MGRFCAHSWVSMGVQWDFLDLWRLFGLRCVPATIGRMNKGYAGTSDGSNISHSVTSVKLFNVLYGRPWCLGVPDSDH